jgi:hypothetical protein
MLKNGSYWGRSLFEIEEFTMSTCGHGGTYSRWELRRLTIEVHGANMAAFNNITDAGCAGIMRALCNHTIPSIGELCNMLILLHPCVVMDFRKYMSVTLYIIKAQKYGITYCS